MYVYLVRTWRYFWWASGARVFWTLVGCTVAGGLLGTLVLLPLWTVFGLPVA
jgi:hypothetical protein